MRSLKRNMRTLFYCEYEGIAEVLDDNGFIVGHKVMYSQPVRFEANIMPNGGEADTEQYGINESYSVKICTNDMTCPIQADTVLFIDKEPIYDAEGNPLFDHIVTRRAETINSITFLADRVKVS